MTDSPIKVGGGYVENENHVPNPTDMVAQFNTSGTGAYNRIEEVAPVFEVDKVKTAQEIEAALDPKNTNVPATRVLLPSPEDDNEAAKKALLERTKARVKEGVVVGGPTPAEREAELDGDEGEDAATEQERHNAAQTSTGNRDAGQHTGGSAEERRSKAAEDGNKAAKKAASSSSSSSAKKDEGKGGTEGSAKKDEQPA